jgi:hypothetical protein
MNNTSTLKYHPTPHQQMSDRLMRSATFGARMTAADTLYHKGHTNSHVSVHDILGAGGRPERHLVATMGNLNATGKSSYFSSVPPSIDEKIINYKLLDDFLHDCVMAGYRVPYKPFLLPIESKIFASIYVPTRPHPIKFKISKDVVDRFIDILKSKPVVSGINPQVLQHLKNYFGRLRNQYDYIRTFH